MDYNSPTDVRILVENNYDIELLSKALKNISIEDDYDIIISSLISTTNSNLIKKTVKGADVVLIATREVSNAEFNNYIDLLKDEVGHIERIDFSDIDDAEFLDSEVIGKRMENAIIRAGLSSIKILNYFQEMEKQVSNSLIKINELNKEIKEINSKNYELTEKLEEQININSNLQIEIDSNTKHINKLTEKYNALKSKNTYFEEKKLNEVFSVQDLWIETFNESLNSYERIIFATNHFKPNNIIVGQGLISAPNKEVAIHWLKVVKTALFFVDSNNTNLEESSEIETPLNTEQNNDVHNSEVTADKKRVKKDKKYKKDINSKIMDLWE